MPIAFNVRQLLPPGAWAWRQWLLCAALVALGYVATGSLGLTAPQIGTQIALIWMASGVALAAMLGWSVSLWPAVLLGSAVVNIAAGAPPTTATAIAVGNTFGALLAAIWLRHQGFDPRLQRRLDLGLLIAASIGASAVSAANGTFWLWSARLLAAKDVSEAVQVWWMGDLLGVLLASVPVLLWPRWGAAQRDGLGTSVLVAAAVASACSAFFLQSQTRAALTPLAFAPHFFLCWLVMRGKLHVASAVIAGLAVVASLATSRGIGPFHTGESLQGAMLLWGYTASLCAMTLLIHALLGELSRHEERWQDALDTSNLGVAEWDSSGRASFTSRRWRALLDDPDGTLTSTPRRWMERVHAEDVPRAHLMIDGLATPGRDRADVQVRIATIKGWRWFECHTMVVERSAQGPALRVLATVADVTDRREAQERERLSSNVFDHLHEGLLVTDAQLRVLEVNPAYLQITGATREELLGHVPTLLQAGAGSASRQGEMWETLEEAGAWRGEVIERRRNGDPCALQLTISAVKDSEGATRYHMLVISDITEQRLQRERLERQANFDELTRLPNRTRLGQMLAGAMAASQSEGHLLVVCYLDLDHFKPVNDTHGHAAGDRLLVELAQRLRGALRNHATGSDIAARLGGDEFVLLLRAGTAEEARLAVERVLRVIAQPYPVEAGAPAVVLSASIGATIYPLDRSDPDTLLRHADHSMYGAKQAGRNGYLFFDPEHSRRTEERVLAIGRLQEALDEHELVLHYQPKVDMRRGPVLGMEALLRWNHPEHGMIPPAEFLPLIEHTGLSARVGDWVLEQALDQLAHWQRMGLDLSVSVNVSARHLQEPDFAQRLAELLARHTRPIGSRLELEVLETAALADVGYTSSLLERCRQLGVRFALDDFGTGYSTLTYLKRLPVDVLKIDRSFVHNMLDDPQDLAIVEGVIGLARTFGCTVVAEGVETAAQARLLIEIGCDIGQGMGIAAPMPASDVYRWVRDFRGPFVLSTAFSADDDTSTRVAGLSPG